MNRREFINIISSGAVAASFSNNAMSAEPGPRQVNRSAERLSKRPNILWICTDQQRYDTIGALGNKYIRTPNLDKLIETGTAFTHAYCQNPICLPLKKKVRSAPGVSSLKRFCLTGRS